jgi:hypothetical protein
VAYLPKYCITSLCQCSLLFCQSIVGEFSQITVLPRLVVMMFQETSKTSHRTNSFDRIVSISVNVVSNNCALFRSLFVSHIASYHTTSNSSNVWCKTILIQ